MKAAVSLVRAAVSCRSRSFFTWITFVSLWIGFLYENIWICLGFSSIWSEPYIRRLWDFVPPCDLQKPNLTCKSRNLTFRSRHLTCTSRFLSSIRAAISPVRAAIYPVKAAIWSGSCYLTWEPQFGHVEPLHRFYESRSFLPQSQFYSQ